MFDWILFDAKDPLNYVFWVGAYFIGGISFAYLIGKLIKGIDLREHGSGNLGSTNVLRVLGKKWGFLCLFLDAMKGAGPVFLALQFLGDVNHLGVLVTGIFAIMGHVFTPYLGFKGGKGVATSLGVFAVLAPFPVLLAFFLFVFIVLVTGYVSLGSMIGAVSVPISFGFFIGIQNYELLFGFLVILAILIVYTHRANIRRIFNGQERKISAYWSSKK